MSARSWFRSALRAVNCSYPELGDRPAGVVATPGAVRVIPRPHALPWQPVDVGGQGGPAWPIASAQFLGERHVRAGFSGSAQRHSLTRRKPQELPGLSGQAQVAVKPGHERLPGCRHGAPGAAFVQADVAARGPSSPTGPHGSATSALVNLNGGIIGQVFNQLKLVGHQLVTRQALHMPGRIGATGRGVEAAQWHAAVHAFKTYECLICLLSHHADWTSSGDPRITPARSSFQGW